MRLWSSRLGLTKVCERLFPFKNRSFQSYSLLSSASIYVNSGILDPADVPLLGFQLECEHDRSQCELPYFLEGSGFDRKDPDPT
jgi:hypothetical protein